MTDEAHPSPFAGLSSLIRKIYPCTAVHGYIFRIREDKPAKGEGWALLYMGIFFESGRISQRKERDGLCCTWVYFSNQGG